MRYCERCILPETRPGLELGVDGVCSACRAHERRAKEIDWDARAASFRDLVARVKAMGRPYDCVVPVSGGKDSHWQMVTCLEHDLHPLAVTWKAPARTEVGTQNMANLIECGVDHIDFQVNPAVERKLLYRSLVRYGTTALPMHLAIFNIPVTLAARFDISLIVWGENSAQEYTGTGKEPDSERLDSRWVARYGVVHGTTAGDWVSEDLTERELTPYFSPSDEELERKGIEGIFLGHFFRWDPQLTYEVARAHGFQSESDGARTGVYEFADIDDEFISIHHWVKWLKFGFTRSYDNLSLEIRNGRVTREQAIEVLRERGDETPHEDIAALCRYLDMTVERFVEIVERFRNREVWTRRNGVWMIDGFLINDWVWR